MADKKKTSDKRATPESEVEDAVIVTPSDESTPPVVTPETGKPEDAEETATPEQSSEAEQVISETPAPVEGPEDEGQKAEDPEAAEPAADETPDEKPDPRESDATGTVTPPVARTETVVVRKGGFLPMLLGGVAAAAIGFGVAYTGAIDGLPLPVSGATQDRIDALSQQIDAQDSTISDLTSRLSTLEDAPAPEAPTAADPSPMIEDLSAQIAALSQRLETLESRPAPRGGAVDTETQAALNQATAELDRIRQAVEAQRAEIAALTDAAAQEEEAARQSAQRVMQRAALTRIQTAIDTGTPFADAVAELRDSGAAVPAPLEQQAADGVATLAALQSSFPDLARDALRAARQQNGVAGIGGFLETQLGLRSLEPREGDDPDAVLSRAEAALRDGDLTQSLTELDALPDPAKSVLADWRARAETRLSAVSAAQELSQALNTN
ncbi:MAG: hypothetical protein LPK02_03115 [Rhodobacterales bacterium]|nr:hypothetical protein [Rhodobacterales bacterium]MDX5412017.1 hypothetical protein [Rhodobacterales bacterium]